MKDYKDKIEYIKSIFKEPSEEVKSILNNYAIVFMGVLIDYTKIPKEELEKVVKNEEGVLAYLLKNDKELFNNKNVVECIEALNEKLIEELEPHVPIENREEFKSVILNKN